MNYSFKKIISSILSLLVLAILCALPKSAHADNGHYLIDMGDSTQQTSDTGWNNSYLGHNNYTLVDSGGGSSSVTIAVSAGTPAYNTAGSTATGGPYPVSAQRDSHYVSSTGFAGSTATVTYIFSNLTPTRTYNFTLFASRDGVADIRTADYTIGGTTVTLNASNNVTEKVTILGVAPTSGQISITFQKAASNNTGANFFAYLGVIEITSVEGGSSMLMGMPF